MRSDAFHRAGRRLRLIRLWCAGLMLASLAALPAGAQATEPPGQGSTTDERSAPPDPLSILPGDPVIADALARDALGRETLELMLQLETPGDAEALLGVLFLRGVRLDPDPVAAFAWFDRAIEAGHPAGIYAAARMLADGVGVAADPGRAADLLADVPPERFGGLADAVRDLRRRLNLPAEPPTSPPLADR